MGSVLMMRRRGPQPVTASPRSLMSRRAQQQRVQFSAQGQRRQGQTRMRAWAALARGWGEEEDRPQQAGVLEAKGLEAVGR